MSLAGVSLLGSAWALGEITSSETDSNTPIAYGFLISDNSGRDVGLYTFPVENPTSPILVAKSEDVSAGTMAAGTYYAATYSGSPATPITWNTVDLSTGTFTKLADFAEGSPLYVDMTYDYARNKLLGIYHYNGNSSSVVEINPSNGSIVTTYADLPMKWILGIAASYEGDIYMIGRGNTFTYYLYKLDDSRNVQTIGQTETMGDYMQSIEFDHKTGKLYWAASSRYDGYMFEENTSTGQATTLAAIGDNGELTGLYIPFKLAADGTPAAASNLTVANPSHDGNVTLTFTVPTTTVDGKSLASVSGWKIMCDDKNLDIPFQNATPGSTLHVDANVETGMHLFKVIFTNDIGEGAPANHKAYIGVDTPAAPVGINITVEGSDATLKWNPVTNGANGGWIDASAVTYTVVRNPDNKEVAQGLTSTSFEDKVTKMDVYQYAVMAVAEGKESAPGFSDMVAIGEGIDLPYECSFDEPQDLVLWSSIDVNADGYTWQRTKNNDETMMLVRSTYSYACDEWLISPSLKLEAGKEYKIVYDLGAMNTYYPPEYSLYLGKEGTPEALNTKFHSESVEEFWPAHRIIYLPAITESGTYHIGIRTQWDAGLPALYFGNVKIEENHAARLTLAVSDTDGAPLKDAIVKFGANSDTYLTDENGKINVIEIEPGVHNVKVEKFGYITDSFDLTFSPNEAKQHSITLKNIPVTTITGTVKYATGKPMGDATVYVNGYDNYTAVTDASGSFTIENVFVEGNYIVEVHAINYLPETIEVKEIGTTPVTLGDIILQEKLTAPANVKHEYDRTKVDLSWDAPVDKEETFRYDDGQSGLINSYSMSPNISNNTVTGTVYDTPGVYTGMSFKADNFKEIGIVIFDLNENGEPTSDILYEQTVNGDSWNWVDVTFTHPVIAPRGALFALRGDSRLYFDGNTDGTRNEGYPVKSNKMWLSYDYTSADEPFHWEMNDGSGPLFNYNFCLRATGRTLGAPRKVQNIAETAAPVVGYDVWRLPEGSESSQADWIKLNETPVAEAAYTDVTWNAVSKGLYKYAVKAVYTGDELSYPVFSEVVPRQLTSSADITLLTNVPDENASGAAAVLVEKEGIHSYSADADAEGKLHFDNVWEGNYTLTVTCQGYEVLTEDINVSGESDFTATYTLKETVSMPFNIAAEDTETPNTKLLRWNFRDSYFEDFESYPDFTVHPEGDIAWSYIDADGITDVCLQNSRYEGIDAAAFVVLNSATTGEDARYTAAHSGDKAIVSLPSDRTSTPTDDYIISPELGLKGEFVINFWLHSYWVRNDYYRVGYSSTGNNVEDFTWTEKVAVPDDKWINPTINIPAGTKYVAINYGDTFRAGVIDDIYIGPASAVPGITAKSILRIAGTPVRYEVYLDGNKLGETDANEWLLENLVEGSHTAGVKSIYASGVSEMAVTNFVVGSSGIIDVDSESIRVITSGDMITVSGITADDVVLLYDVAGVNYPIERSEGIAIASGIAKGRVYILSINGQAYRIML